MTGPIGHIVYAARLLTFLDSQVHDPVYWLGAVFPDIRQTGAGIRHRPHVTGVTLKTIMGRNDFQTGRRVHSWIATTRQQWLEDALARATLPWHPLLPYALGFIEDSLLYDHFDDWNLIRRLLTRIHDEELHYVASRSAVQRWHTGLQHYFQASPTDDSRHAWMEHLGLSRALATEVTRLIQTLAQDKRITALLDRFIRHFEQLLT